MRKRLLLPGLALLGMLVCSAQSGGVGGEWRGMWTDPAGNVFTAAMTLQEGAGCKLCAVMGDGSIRGRIVWTLRKAGPNAPAAMAARVGATGTELVRGEMKGDGLLVLNGYAWEDSALKAVDQYRLAISDNGKVVGGITLNGGSWTGQFIAVRAQPQGRMPPA
jgi:hypothetical protein